MNSTLTSQPSSKHTQLLVWYNQASSAVGCFHRPSLQDELDELAAESYINQSPQVKVRSPMVPWLVRLQSLELLRAYRQTACE